MNAVRAIACAFVLASAACGATPQSTVVIDNDYPLAATGGLVVYRARFETADFDAPISPGSSSSPQTVLPTSGDMAYVLLAPGWDPASDAGPAAFVVLESDAPVAAPAGGVARIPVSDSTFRGRCDAGSSLTQAQADAIVGAFFADVFAGLSYDAASCATAPLGDAGVD